MDECALGTDYCSVNALCSDTPGSFICTYNAGFDGDGARCISKDIKIDKVKVLKMRFILGNSFIQSDATKLFTDVDECSEGTDDCHVNAICTDTPGSFICTCNPGFEGNGRNCTIKESKTR